ncbi:MAG: PD40 domain-containing protein [Crocinitomicaceae bacterium]|nr:PD40 domain-containing protein [Crocinitomicaceae bacterium]
MSNFYRAALSLCFVFSIAIVHGKSLNTTPPDSTTAIVDKASSLYMVEEGKTSYGEGKVRDALIKFRQASVKDKYSWRAVYWISKCHYKLNNYGLALKYANSAMNLGKDKINDEIYYILGSTYHRLGNLDTAKINYQIAFEKLPKLRSFDLQIAHNISQCEFATEILKNGNSFERVRLGGDINSGFDDYNVLLTNDGKTMYFTSRRSNTTGGRLNPDDQLYYEDIYKVEWDEAAGEWDDITNKMGKLNSDGFESLHWISSDTLTGVITWNTTMMDIKKTTRVSDIAIIKKNNKGTWNTAKVIKNKSINTSFYDGSPTLTADGNTMYFVSDRKGEKSGRDIYVVEKIDKKWGTATLLPEQINTKKHETTPFITPDGQYLFFSSDGHEGMGGFDVFVCKNLGGTWSAPVNMGAGINTVNDDIFFSYSKESKKAFVSGYQITGKKASIDIYEIDMTAYEFPK